MRIFTERDDRSPFVGEHTIYDSTEEFEEKNPGKKWKKWGFEDPNEITIGDWFRVDDGYVIEILKLKRFHPETPKDTLFIRVPMGTFSVYMTRKGWKWRQLYAQFSVPHKGSISQRSRIYHGGMIDKIKFATLVISGVSLTQAVRMVTPSLHHITKTQLLLKAAKYMNDEVVQVEIRTQIAKFNDDIEKKFGDERIINELDLLINKSRKGSDAHRTNIQFIMELRRMYEQQSNGKNKIRNAEPAEYKVVPPSEAER